MSKFVWAVGIAKHCRFWIRGHASYLLDNRIHRQKNVEAGYVDHDHLMAAARWLEAAQDATDDGGIVGRYRLNIGWTSTYPETTGYIVPTLLALAADLGNERFKARARRAVDFLLGIQLPNGAFPGLEIAANRTDPSPFNTAQIINGLVVWAASTGDERALHAAQRAGDWLISIQDDDGAWRKHFYYDVAPTYSAHIACWLAQLGQHSGDRRYLDAASRNIDWVLSHRVQETGWIENMGFDAEFHKSRIAHTHTIAYTLWGILYTCEILNRKDGIDAVADAANRIARRLELSRWLPGILDWQWKGAADYACLTGNAQMALIWFKLYRRIGGAHFINAAFKAIDLVKRAQPMENPNPGIRGGIAGSDPMWGGYIFVGIPNWAAKYFIDALLEKKRILGSLPGRPRGEWQVPVDVAQKVPEFDHGALPAHRVKVVLLASRSSKKVAQMCASWKSWGFKPDLVIIERAAEPNVVERLWAAVEARGLQSISQRALGLKGAASGTVTPATAGIERVLPTPEEYCIAHGVGYIVVDDINGPASLQKLEAVKPDVAVHAGAGIIRSELLAILRLGLINAHMGVLPRYRGMNVSEWAAFHGDPVGCTVHLIDPGIDTGAIICARTVETSDIGDVTSLRARVDDAQIALLGEVLRYVSSTAQLPPSRQQDAGEGIQFFRIHPDLARFIFARDGAT